MRTRTFRMILMMAVVIAAAAYSSTGALAETRLYVPRFQFNESEDTQFLVANENERDAVVDFWAFTANGELLGQFQLSIPANGTRALTLGEAFRLEGQTVTGWVGVVSPENGIQLSYTRRGETIESFKAQTWPSREVQLNVDDPSREVVRLSNPNPFGASVTLYGMDLTGQSVGMTELSVEAFGQKEVPVGSLLRGSAKRLRITSNADVLAGMDRPMQTRVIPRQRLEPQESEQLALAINSEQGIGAYQVTLNFDPRLVQFSTKDIEGGTAMGFDSKPLVVNIDNVAGRMTLASFQVGATPSGRSIVARMRVPAGVRFGIEVDKITDTTGGVLTDLSVGVVRVRE